MFAPSNENPSVQINPTPDTAITLDAVKLFFFLRINSECFTSNFAKLIFSETIYHKTQAIPCCCLSNQGISCVLVLPEMCNT